MNTYSKSEAEKIIARNERSKKEERQYRVDVRRKREDYQLCKKSGITIEELNHNRMHQ